MKNVLLILLLIPTAAICQVSPKSQYGKNYFNDTLKANVFFTTGNVGINNTSPTVKLRVAGRFASDQGAAVASANNLSLGTDGNTFEITGTTQINLISNTTWVNGSIIHLHFASTPTVKNGQTTSTTNITILLAGAADFSATANDVLVLQLASVGGTQAWREICRSVN